MGEVTSAPVTDVTVGREVISVRVLRSGYGGSFDAMLDALESLVRGGEMVALSADPWAYGLEDHWSFHAFLSEFGGTGAALSAEKSGYGLRSLVESIGNCSSISFDALGACLPNGLEDVKGPVLVGAKSALRYVCACAPHSGAEEYLVISTPVRDDFSRFRYLWSESEPFQEIPGQSVFRKLDGYEIGKALGRFHNGPVLWNDAHRRQFGFSRSDPDTAGEAIVYDLDEHVFPLYRLPSVGQCATMLVPLLSEFTPSEFDGFFAGYVGIRGETGEHVLNYIVNRDQVGWKYPFDRGDYSTSALRLATAIERNERVGDDEDLAKLLFTLGVCYMMLDKYDDARQVYERALSVAEHAGIETRTILFNLGQCSLELGDVSRAASLFSVIVQEESERTTPLPGLVDAAIEMLNRCSAS